MLTSGAYSPEPEYASAVLSTPDRSDSETAKRCRYGEPYTEALKKHILEALGASAWQVSQQTFGYRWRGEDTLNSGNLDIWIQSKLALCLVDRSQTEACLMGYGPLREFIAESARLRQLGVLYLLCDSVAVRHFLRANPQLIHVLLEAHFHLREHFGPNSQVVLEVVSDPEAKDQEQLFAYIRTSLPVDEALAGLDRLDEEWFLGQLDQVGGLLNFNLEFV